MPVIPYVYPKIIPTRKSLRRAKMSVGAIDGIGAGVGPLLGTKGVEEPAANASSGDNGGSNQAIPTQTNEDPEQLAKNEQSIYAVGSTSSTQDFMQLRGSSRDEDQFAALDFVINKMRENTEAQGEIIEAVMKNMQKVSKQTIGLQILVKTFEAIDEMRGEGSKSKSYGHF